MLSAFEALRIEYRDILRHCFKTKNIEQLENRTKSTIDLKAPLDQAFRDILLEFLEAEIGVETLRELVDFSILTCRKELSNATMPVVLLSDIFDALTLDVCQDMFLYVEDNVEIWKEPLFFACCKNNLLRLCNDLLRRLSRSTATVFCGRILLFLAKFFPFSERSGLNIVSEFNLENVTEYGEQETNPDPQPPTDDTFDFTFYCKFWSLQDFFRNPNQLYNKVQWKLFCSHAGSVLNTFHGLKLEHLDVNGPQTKEGAIYFSKYLTSRKLLDLQLYDVNFRRSILLQFLILFQYLQSVVKFKSDSYELKMDQKEWLQTHTEKIYNLLRDTPPDGKRFAEIVQMILAREEFWNNWKNEGCPELKKSHLQRGESPEKLRKLNSKSVGELIKDATNQNKYYMGSSELTKLWNLCPDNLEACKDRNFLPTLDEYFQDAIMQLDGHKDDNLLKDGNYGWRALRLLAKRSPHFFTYSTVIMNPLSSYLEMMVRKIAHDRPGRTQDSMDSQQNDTEMENLFKDTQDDENADDMKQDDYVERYDTKISEEQLQKFAEKVAENWQKLANKLGFKSDEIEFFIQEHPDDDVEQAKTMLKLWFYDDEDATLENFIYILEGLGLYDQDNQ